MDGTVRQFKQHLLLIRIRDGPLETRLVRSIYDLEAVLIHHGLDFSVFIATSLGPKMGP